MGALQAKPEWLDGDEDGNLLCSKCAYKTNVNEYLDEHTKTYHDEDRSFVLYMCCDGSIEGRNALNDRISAQWIDCTGGQAAYEDGDIQEFGDELVEASRKTNVKIFHVFRMFDPGLGLDFPLWWVEGGIKAGVFSQYTLPNDVVASFNENNENEEENDENDEN